MIPWVVVAATVATASADASVPAPSVPPACVDPGSVIRVEALLRDRRPYDAHQLALTLDVLCAPTPAQLRFRLLDGIALARLDDVGAVARLHEVATLAGEDLAPRARVALAWARLRAEARPTRGSDPAQGLGPADAARLRGLDLTGPDDAAAFAAAMAVAFPADDTRRQRAHEARQAVAAARRTRKPWLAGTLSAVLPGAGQAYAGSWQGAAVALLLNAAFVGATVELVRNDLPFAAGVVGLGASMTWVGNVVNAADLAARRNAAAAEAPTLELERILVPEVAP